VDGRIAVDLHEIEQYFGLFSVDYDAPELSRTRLGSADTYAAIIAAE
jgi:hypothetical protein